MKRRKWNSKEKSQIVLEGLRSQTTVGDLCLKYGITQAQYYQWRDRFLGTCHEAFENSDKDKRELRFREEIRRLRGIIGELTVELKKSEDEL